MAGNHRSGRKPRALRQPVPVGERLVKPTGLPADQSEFWDRVIEPARHLSAQDLPLALSACELWVMYCQARDAAAADPVDKDARIAVTSYWTTWSKSVERLQLDPLGRTRAARPADDPVDPLKEFGIIG